MLRFVVPVLAVLACAGCGGSRNKAAAPAPAKPVAAAPGDAAVKPEPAAAPAPPAPAPVAVEAPAAPAKPVARAEPEKPVVRAVEPAPAPVKKVVKAEPAKPVKYRKGEEPAIVQPAAPELPADFGLDTTPKQLAAHALIVAREQVAAGLSGQADVLQRREYLVAIWTPQLAERQKAYGAIRDRRARVVAKQVADVGERADREARLQAMEADYAHRLEVENLRTAPVESR